MEIKPKFNIGTKLYKVVSYPIEFGIPPTLKEIEIVGIKVYKNNSYDYLYDKGDRYESFNDEDINKIFFTSKKEAKIKQIEEIKNDLIFINNYKKKRKSALNKLKIKERK
jgi:hypothetical protein